jgi:uncharacterized protein with FMN-binding domain
LSSTLFRYILRGRFHRRSVFHGKYSRELKVKRVCQLAIPLSCFSEQGTPFASDDKKLILEGLVEPERLTDGVYEGNSGAGPNKALVRVTIEEGKIVKIETLKHRAWKGKKAEAIIPMRIIEHQSTKVDAVTGATNSSRVIMNAVQKAIEKAYER